MKTLPFFIIILLFSAIKIYSQGQLVTYYKEEYSGSAALNNINGEEALVFTASQGSFTRIEISIWEPFGYTNQHNSQTINNFSVTPTPSQTSSNGNRNTYIYENLNTSQFQFVMTYDSETDVDLGSGFHSDDTYPVYNEPSGTLDATDSIQSDNSSIISEANAIVQDLEDMRIQSAVRAVGQYMRSEITYREDDEQDALSVLNKGSGSCKGQSRLAVALLRSLDIPARKCGGTILNEPFVLLLHNGNYATKGTSGPGLHAIYEVYYPTQGWVQGDPQGWLHFYNQNFIKASDNSPDATSHISGSVSGSNLVWNYVHNINTSIGSLDNNYQYKDFDKFEGSSSSGNTLYAVYDHTVPTFIEPTGPPTCEDCDYPGAPDPPTITSVSFDSDYNVVDLEWDSSPAEDSVNYYIIYRCPADVPMADEYKLDSTVNTYYLDADFIANEHTSFKYAVAGVNRYFEGENSADSTITLSPCNDSYLYDMTLSSSDTIKCGNIHIKGLDITNNSDVVLDYTNHLNIDTSFTVESGSTITVE